MCRDLNELAGVCLCHGWYYSGDGRNGNRVLLKYNMEQFDGCWMTGLWRKVLGTCGYLWNTLNN